MGRNILVTGAGGFIGSHICRYFGEQGHLIAAVGRFSSPFPAINSYPNLWKLYGIILPDPNFKSVVKEFKPDILIHCAGTASVANSVVQPYNDFQRTVEVSAFTLEVIRKEAPNCRYILLSSAAVYGNPNNLPIIESAPCKPVSPYGYHKMICEMLVEEYSTLYGIPVNILRLFSAYGENLKRQVIYDLCKKFSDTKSEVVEVYGTGDETRDFIHVMDVAKAIEIIINSNSIGIFNIASGRQTKISSLVDILSERYGQSKKIVYTGDSRTGDPLHWQADILKLTNLGFSPSISLENGIKGYCQWFESIQKTEHI